MLALDKEDIISIFSNPVLKNIYSDVFDLLRISRKLIFYHPYTFFDFQKLILKRIEQIEGELIKIPQKDPQERTYKYMIRIYKWIMDGIALRVTGFNPNAYRILSDNRSPGPITGKKGLAIELKKLKELLDDGKFALLNDLTNFIRLGDITIYKPGNIELLEIKTGKAKNNPNKNTLNLQEKKLKRAEKMINENICIFKDDIEGKLELIPIIAKTYINKIKTLLLKAQKYGISHDEINNILKITVLDFEKCNDLNIDVKEELVKIEDFPENDEKHPFSNFDLSFSKHGEFLRSVYSPTVWKLPVKLITDLLLGKKYISVTFNFTNFYSKFTEAGYKIEHNTTPLNKDIGSMFNKRTMPLENSKPPSAIIVRKDGWFFELPDTLLPRIVYEFLHPDSALDLVNYAYQSRNSRAPGHYLFLFKNHLNLYL